MNEPLIDKDAGLDKDIGKTIIDPTRPEDTSGLANLTSDLAHLHGSTPLDATPPFVQTKPDVIQTNKSPWPIVIAVLIILGLGIAVWKFALPLYNNQMADVQDLSAKKIAKGPLKSYAKGSLVSLVTLSAPKSVDNIQFFDREHKAVHLSDFKGRVVVLNVWATWCAPCRTEMPTLAKLQGQYDADKVKVLALSVDVEGDFSKAKSFIDVHDPLELYVDPNFAAPSKFGIKGMPTTLILDKQGREVARLEGEAKWDTPEVKALLNRLNN